MYSNFEAIAEHDRDTDPRNPANAVACVIECVDCEEKSWCPNADLPGEEDEEE